MPQHKAYSYAAALDDCMMSWLASFTMRLEQKSVKSQISWAQACVILHAQTSLYILGTTLSKPDEALGADNAEHSSAGGAGRIGLRTAGAILSAS